jgi:hypothetical protein
MPGPRDRFGLPLRPLSPLGNTLAEHAARETAVEALVHEVFAKAVRHLGRWRARDLFKRVMTQKRGPPRGKGRAHTPALDAELLAEYDRRAANLSDQQRKALPRLMGQECAGHQGYAFRTVDPASLVRRIRRLVQKRSRIEATSAENHSILGGARSSADK